MIDLRKIRHLLGVVEFGGFANAADALNITQSALTKSVQSIEATLGFRVLERTSRGVFPTAEGEWFIERATRLLADAELIGEHSRAVRELRGGRLRVGVAPAAFDWVAATPAAEFARSYPLVKLELVNENVDMIRRFLLQGRVDVALGVLSELECEPELVITLLRKYSVHMFVRRGHPLDLDERPEPEALFRYPMVGTPRAEPLYSAYRAMRPQDITDPEVFHYVADSFPLVMRLVQATDAFSMVVEARALDPRFRRVFRTWRTYDALPPHLTIYAATRVSSVASPAVKRFLALCAEKMFDAS